MPRKILVTMALPYANGPLHLGHYFGTLANRVRLQQAGVELLVLIADYQAITDRTAKPIIFAETPKTRKLTASPSAHEARDRDRSCP